ncbi:MAG: hypothetical protein J6I49_07290 [Bacteroidales bacterium]|nr:hypothetical protein [Bacteroidales bacterium]
MKRPLILLVSVMLAFVSCRSHTEQVQIHRFEHLLFSTPADQLSSTLAAQFDTYNSPLLNLHPSDPDYMAMLHGFVSDPTVRRIYKATDSLYHDLLWLEQSLGKAMQRASKLCPEVQCQRFYTLITADFQNYDSRVFCYNGDMAISIDRYAVGAMPDMQHFGLPAYLVRLCSREHILADCMAAAVRARIQVPEGDMTFLDHAIAEGKVLYCLEQLLPDQHDTILLRYSAEQLRWMQDNTKHVWGWYIQNEVLYSSDLAQLRNLIDDAPKTNAFGDGSAPRTGAYIGWQIVRRYMKKNTTDISRLLAETDSRKILTDSGWRP